MTAFEQNNKNKKLEEKDSGSMDLGRRIFELFMSRSLDSKAALAAMKVIPVQSDLGKKSVQCWRATILLESVSLEQTGNKSEPAQQKRRKQGRRILKNLLVDSFDAAMDEKEREVVFLAMLTLGRYDTEHGDQKDRLIACDVLAKLVAMTILHDSPLQEQANNSYNKACESLVRGYMNNLVKDTAKESSTSSEHKAATKEEAA